MSPNIPIFCDFCGDITVAYKPITVTFWDETKLLLNVCLDCSSKIESSRAYKKSALLRILLEEE